MTMFRNGRSSRSVARTTAALLTALVAALLLAVGQAAAAPGTQTWTGQAAGATPDIELGGLTLFNTSGGAFISNASAGTLNFTVNGTAYIGYCTDTTELFSTGTEPVEVTTQAPPATAATRAAAWIILNRTVSGAPTPAKQQQAAVTQVALWLLLDGNINKTTPTSDAALNAAAAALVAEAQAATATPSTLTVTAATPAAGATSTTVTITGKPGAVVSLSASGGTLSAPSVTLGASGTATVTLSVAGPGTATVSASAAGDGNYIAIEPTGPTPQPQATAAATPSTLTASVGATFTATQVTPSGPTTPIAGGATARLVITKKAPARARPLSRVKYTIVVRNTSKVAARSVVLRDAIPSGLSLVTASRARTLNNGVITFRLGTLAPGASRTVTVTMLADASVRGKRTNVATVSATGVRAVRAAAATVFRTLARRVQPAVTG
jgi:uncharacterized repeat protein (TIGR01451 family)